jgi:hypothetical protein
MTKRKKSLPGIQKPNKLTVLPKVRLRDPGKPRLRIPPPPPGKFADIPGQPQLPLEAS